MAVSRSKLGDKDVTPKVKTKQNNVLPQDAGICQGMAINYMKSRDRYIKIRAKQTICFKGKYIFIVFY